MASHSTKNTLGWVGNKWVIDLRHPGLDKYQRFQGLEPYVVEQRADSKAAQWDQQWQKKQIAEQKRREREHQRLSKEAKKEEAIRRTREAEQAVEELEGLLDAGLKRSAVVNFDSLKDVRRFPEPRPHEPSLQRAPPKPPVEDRAYFPLPVTFWTQVVEAFSSAAKEKRLAHDAEEAAKVAEEVRLENEQRLRVWEGECARVEATNTRRRQEHEAAVQRFLLAEREFIQQQMDFNTRVERFRQEYLERKVHAVERYTDLVLTQSPFPDCFPQDFELEYRDAGGILVVDYQLPPPDSMPDLKAVRYVQTRDEFTETKLSEAARKKLYDDAIYQAAIRTLHELVSSDLAGAIQGVVLNGRVQSIDPATGNEVNACIISIQATKEQFSSLNLAAVDAKACFRKLKGVGSSKLHSISAVAPILRLSTEDSRFVDGRAVIEGVNEGSNLAAMDWEDFEHLIREIFAQEFSRDGGEVKVTHASRDGGVDAIAFDPDPIRGGKFVIQAKRYTAVVPVSAVRDLYGTMINEGATKGILVTTSTFGPDSYTFAKDKPLTLLDGSNLLHMLGRHGTKAYIDIKEARAEREQ